MPREFSRSDRVASQIQRELAALLHQHTKDPRFKLLVVNAVKVTRDLSVATVYIATLSEEPDSAGRDLQALTHAASFLRRELSGRIRLRNIPELRFVYDESIERARRIESLLESANDHKPH